MIKSIFIEIEINLRKNMGELIEKDENKGGEHLNIKVLSPEKGEVFFKIKKSTPLKKLMEAYCEKVGKQRTSVKFLFDGQHLNGNQTVEELGLEDNDIIETKTFQVGGVK